MHNVTDSPKANRALTKRVTELHRKGYDHDFVLTPAFQLFCLQNNYVFIMESTSVTLVDQVYDDFFGQYKYVYVVESECGEKGILLLDFIHFGAIAQSSSFIN
ncbi:hypothetical protein ACFQZI_07075 [Mucilaginibacter lutimaris]|uniref:Uncharacterized protein n=1 Tax=Mucilaginibacter lutimaris TaxID=931629 RepID=A0ABW2ZEH6_9SPHI